MVIGSRQRLSKISNELEIHVGETTIKRVSYAKTLGIVIDDHLTWERQIDNIQTKISKGIGMLQRMKKIVPITALKKFIMPLYYHILTTAVLFGIIVVII